MITSTIRAAVLSTLTIALIFSTNVTSAFAIPDPGYPSVPVPVHQTDAPCTVVPGSADRLLRRIGTQFVRGDDLTGAGVPAPSWVLEVQ